MSEINNTTSTKSTEESPKQSINGDSSQPLNEQPEAKPSPGKKQEKQAKEAELDASEVMSTFTQDDGDKWTWRRKVWITMKTNRFDSFPMPSFGRIPNFKGSKKAASRLADLEEFKSASAIEVHSERSLEFVRRSILRFNKELYVVTPQHDESFLKKFVRDKNADIRKMVSFRGIECCGTPMKLRADIHLDMMVIGAVVVSKDGHRIGKGYGYTDLEYAILKELGVVDDKTVIATVVHDSQIRDDMPDDLFQKYDIPVDIIVTPTQTIKVTPRQKRPEGVYWNMVTKRRMYHMRVLEYLREICSMNGVDVTFQSTSDTDGESERPEKIQQPEETVHKVEMKNGKGSKQKYRKPRQFDYSLKITNIDKTVTLAQLRDVLTLNGVRPTSIYWRGKRDNCIIHYAIKDKLAKDKKLQEKEGVSEIKVNPCEMEDVLATLRKLKINSEAEETLQVEVLLKKKKKKKTEKDSTETSENNKESESTTKDESSTEIKTNNDTNNDDVEKKNTNDKSKSPKDKSIINKSSPKGNKNTKNKSSSSVAVKA